MSPVLLRRGRDQRGFSLVEVLLAMVISVALVVPLGAWVVMAMRQQPIVQDDLVTTASLGLLGIYFPTDVRTAAAAATDANNDDVPFVDCIGGPGSEAAGSVLLVLHIPDDVPRKVVYKEAPLRSGGGADPLRRSIWRRECPLNDPFDTSAVEVLRDVTPGASTASCPVIGVSAVCRHVRLQVVVPGAEPIVVRATRRVDAASLRFDRSGNRLPVAKINVLSQSGEGPFTVTLSPEGSEDPDGDIVEYRWSIPLAPFVEGSPPAFEDRLDPPDPADDPAHAHQVVVWNDPGVYFVQLQVTDDQGATATAYSRVLVGRAGVTADLQVQPESGVAEWTEFEFDASGSAAPPGRVLEYEWVIRSPLPDPFDADGNLLDPPPAPTENSQFTTRRSDPAPFSAALPSSMVRVIDIAGEEFVDGLVEVELTVRDLLEPDASDTVVYPIMLAPHPDTFDLPPSEPSDPADPVAAGLVSRVGATESWRLDASVSQPGSGGDPIVQYRWDHGPGVGVIETPDADVEVPGLLPGGGWFRYLLTATDQQGRTGQFVGSLIDGAALASAPVLSYADGRISWPEVVGAGGYRIEFQFDACGATAVSSFAQGYRTGTMSAPIPPSKCATDGPIRARVVAEHPQPDDPADAELGSNEVLVQSQLLAYSGGG